MIPAVLSNKLRELRFRLVLRHYRKLAITKVALLEKGLTEQATWKKGKTQLAKMKFRHSTWTKRILYAA